ncbi:hypothetical protein FRC09_001348 [Ceratobasidium sp. 395]|nr:hypothetical protein FRC09_001348 [Ceratobasidium sp. 395]
MVAWAAARINFIFIFQLDARTVIDAKEYIEFPAFLLTTLCYAFCLSFSRVGSETIASTTWPAAWVVFAVVAIINPLPMFHVGARYWLLKTFGMLFLSGFTRVEFKDFWLGDQFCSLSYTMANMYFLVCAYTDHWHGIEERCQLGVHWVIPFVLSALPSAIRIVQCIRRFVDSANLLHLVNAAKYAVTIAGYATYYLWRNHGSEWDHYLFIWVIFAAINSCFSTYWDLTMDWSVLQVQGVEYKFLRNELVYSDHIYAYYIAILLNVAIRFVWVGYIPRGGLSSGIRAFMFAFLEMLRRVLWNFFRVENEQIGNADQFRVTREIPLPYVFTEERDSDDEDAGERRPRRRSVRLPAALREDPEKRVGMPR